MGSELLSYKLIIQQRARCNAYLDLNTRVAGQRGLCDRAGSQRTAKSCVFVPCEEEHEEDEWRRRGSKAERGALPWPQCQTSLLKCSRNRFSEGLSCSSSLISD